MKTVKKAISILLTVVMLSTSLVFTLPTSSAAAYPDNLYNGSAKVNYTSADAQSGKYLVEIDAVKYNPNVSATPEAIASEAGDVIITYRPDNGTAPEVTARFEDVIEANAFNYAGEGTFSYYAILEGFPQKATVSVKKTNLAQNDSGLYAALKIWNADIGSFENIFDFTKIERFNGKDTSGLMFSNVSSLLQYYPYAKQGGTSGSNLTLPAGLTPTQAEQLFSVTDQWGVTMMAPKIAYTPVAGLTFSQNKNVMTVKGTGDANNPAASSRTVQLTATYDTLNNAVANTYSVSRSFTVNNSSTLTFAPTYANREKAGLGISFKTSAGAADQFPLNSSYKATTTNYVVLKNNASRTATVHLSTASGDKIRIAQETDTIAAGESKSYQLLDLAAASANYNADTTVTYTLDGLYDAATGTPAQLTAGATIPYIYNKTTTPDVTMEDYNIWPSYTNKVYVKYQSTAGVLDKISSKADGNVSYLKANFYIDTDKYPTYQSAGLGFYAEPKNDYKDYYFQPDESDAGYYVQRGDYESAGTFGFSSSASTHTSRYCEKINIKINGGKSIPFYGTIFKGSNTKDSPAEIYFDGDQDNDDGLDFLLDKGVDNSAYLNSNLYIYAYSKNALRSDLNNRANFLSCYYDADTWTAYASMGDSALRNAQLQLGTDVTSQYKINQAKNAFDSAQANLKNAPDNGNYSLIHNKHVGDIGSVTEATAIDFYVFDVGASNVLKFYGDYANACNKHSDAYTPVMSASGTYEHTYDYWNIDFSSLTAALENYAAVAPKGQFINVDDAVGAELMAARNVDTTSATAKPDKQADVDNIVNELNNAMRDLVYTSFTMSVEHKMLSPNGKEEINNEYVQTYVEEYNRSTTYGEVMDGTANLDDGTYTVKDHHYEPQPDPTFLQYSSSHYSQGVSSEYVCTADKEIYTIYYAKQIEDSTLRDQLAYIEENFDNWGGQYTDISLNAFAAWYDENMGDGSFTKIYSVFDVEEYNAVLAEFREAYNMLDPIATEEQLENVEQFMADYEMLTDFRDAFCNASALLSDYANAYATAGELIEYSKEDNAGQKAAAAMLNSVSGFELVYHSEGAHKVLNAPKDGIDGTFYASCPNCGAVIASGALAAPKFNAFIHPAYDYSNRGAGLKISREQLHEDMQYMRFAASCNVPKGATVKDFGFVYTQTKYLNSGMEPTDNTPVNVDLLVDGGMYVYKKSMIDGNYTKREQADKDVYTFNLLLNVDKANWSIHYAARSYVTYEIDGMEVTVYDSTYSSRAVTNIAALVAANKRELPETRAYIAEKFGL